MLSRYVKFVASIMPTPHRRSLLAVVPEGSHGLRSGSSKSKTLESGEKKPAISLCPPKSKDDKKDGTQSDNGIKPIKVTVLGANGSVGQLLSLFLKQCPLISTLALHDYTSICGLALDVSHIDTSCKVYAYNGKERLKDSLKSSNIIVMATEVPITAKMSKGHLFYKNAEIAYELTMCCCETCPQALIAVLINPINSIVPVVSEVLKKNDCYNSNKVFGIPAVHVVRANTLVAQRMNIDPTGVIVPIIGGTSPQTLVPVLSQTKPCFKPNSPFFQEEVFTYLMCRIRSASQDVMNCKDNGDTPSLAVAYSAARFIHSLAKGLNGQPALECAYVCSNLVPGCPYLTSPVELGPGGIKSVCGLPQLTNFEQALLDEAVRIITEDIKLGTEFVASPNECG